MPINHDMMHAHSPDELERENATLKEMVAKAQGRIAELEAENKRLKKCEIWMKQHFYCEEVIACESAKNRKLKHALWLARAERARTEQRYIFNVRGDGWVRKENMWVEVERLCLKKAEESK